MSETAFVVEIGKDASLPVNFQWATNALTDGNAVCVKVEDAIVTLRPLPKHGEQSPRVGLCRFAR